MMDFFSFPFPFRKKLGYDFLDEIGNVVGHELVFLLQRFKSYRQGIFHKIMLCYKATD